MKKISFIIGILFVLLVSCTASNVNINGTYKGKVNGADVEIFLQRQAENSVFGEVKKNEASIWDFGNSIFKEQGSTIGGTLFDSGSNVYLSLNGYWTVLDGGSKLVHKPSSGSGPGSGQSDEYVLKKK